ncbi:MAG: MFS transporter [Hyphomicrobiales bacterium]|nr:MFS transporter [Hyphomicrobiales bacterium]
MRPSPTPGLRALFGGFDNPVILALGLTQTIGYGSLYYGYGVLAPAIAREFGVGGDVFFGAFTIGLLLGGLVAPRVGRELDRRGARAVMTFGSVLAALALCACALASSIWLFSAALILAEAAACLVLYEAAFAGLTQIYRHAARRGITLVTLMAGFASTVFWPLTQALLAALDWRMTFLAFAALNLAICAPLHFLALRGATSAAMRAAAAHAEAAPSEEPPRFEGAERRRALLLYGAAIVISGLVFAAFPIHMLRIIENEGFSAEQAALIAMVMGPAQVAARIVEVAGGARFDPLMTGRVALGSLVAAVALLLATPSSTASALVFAALYGIAQGLITIARGTVPLQLFGVTGYATLVGRITGLRFLANAFSPFLFAAAMTHIGVDPALWVSALCAALAFGAFLLLRPPRAG